MNNFGMSDDPTEFARQKEEARREERCATCRFFVSRECRRNPPALVSPQKDYWDVSHNIRIDAVWKYASASPDGWCGEWRMK